MNFGIKIKQEKRVMQRKQKLLLCVIRTSTRTAVVFTCENIHAVAIAAADY